MHKVGEALSAQFLCLDIILVGLRDYQDQKADVIMKYNSDEARRLKNMGHLPESVNVSLHFYLTVN